MNEPLTLEQRRLAMWMFQCAGFENACHEHMSDVAPYVYGALSLDQFIEHEDFLYRISWLWDKGIIPNSIWPINEGRNSSLVAGRFKTWFLETAERYKDKEFCHDPKDLEVAESVRHWNRFNG